MYKLFTDKNENFVCEVSVKNASLKDSISRLVVESANGTNLVFNGQISNGKCTIPIKRLKGLLEENSTGKMFLEVIVEDTYFKPWQSDFTVEEHTSVKVKINEQALPSKKPIVDVKVAQRISLHPAAVELSMLCEKFHITKTSLKKSKSSFSELIREYFSANTEYNKDRSDIFKQLSMILK